MLDVQGVSFPEQHGLEVSPNVRTTPVLAENVRWVLLPGDVCEHNETPGNGFADKMKGEQVVPLVQLGVRYGGALDNRLIVSKDMASLPDRNPKVAKGVAEISDLFNASARRKQLAATSGGLDSRLFLGEPINWGLVEDVNHSRHRPPCDHVMHEVGIDTVGEGDVLSERFRSTVRKDLCNAAINRLIPVMSRSWEI